MPRWEAEAWKTPDVDIDQSVSCYFDIDQSVSGYFDIDKSVEDEEYRDQSV